MKNVDENKIYNETLDVTLSNDCASCTLYIVLFLVFLTKSIIIDSGYIYFHWYSKRMSDNQSHLKKDTLGVNYSATETMTY